MSISRRAFMMDLGKGTLAVAVFGVAAMACSEDDSLPATTTPSTLPESTTTPTTTPETTSPQPTEPVTTTPLETDAVQWERVNLGFVSAYVLARRGEAAVVDTGVSGS